MTNSHEQIMQRSHIKTSALRCALAPDDRRVFVSRGVDLRYRAQRGDDGRIVAESDERGEVKNLAERQGYVVN